MKKAPILKFLPTGQVPEAPPGLDKPGIALWQALQNDVLIDDAGGLSHLLTICRSEDDIVRMRKTVATDGDLVTDRFGQKAPHPLLSAISRAEGVKRQALAALNLDILPLRDAPGRPGGR